MTDRRCREPRTKFVSYSDVISILEYQLHEEDSSLPWLTTASSVGDLLEGLEKLTEDE